MYEKMEKKTIPLWQDLLFWGTIIVFGAAAVIVAFLAVMCIVLPLLPADVFGGVPFSKTPMALPLMATGMLLPFLFFFIFAGPQALSNRNK